MDRRSWTEGPLTTSISAALSTTIYSVRSVRLVEGEVINIRKRIQTKYLLSFTCFTIQKDLPIVNLQKGWWQIATRNWSVQTTSNWRSEKLINDIVRTS